MADSAIAQSIVQELPANIGTALAFVPLLEWLKRSAWVSWINIHSAPYISIAFAFAAAAGIHGVVDSHGFSVSGTWLGLAIGLGEVGKQWLGQHWTYKIYQGFDSLKSLAIAINQLLAVPTRSIPQATAVTEPKLTLGDK